MAQRALRPSTPQPNLTCGIVRIRRRDRARNNPQRIAEEHNEARPNIFRYATEELSRTPSFAGCSPGRTFARHEVAPTSSYSGSANRLA